MRILYIAALSPNDSALYRLWALKRLGHIVLPLNLCEYESGPALLRKITHRLVMGPEIIRLNRDLLEHARRDRPDLLWADKLLGIWPETLTQLRAMGIATISYMIDNAFGPRQDPGWRLYRKCIPRYDLHITQRDRNISNYREQGARDVLKIQTAYEPTLHYPPPPSWSDRDRDRDVSFIGTPYDNRARILTGLAATGAFGVAISGSQALWRQALGPHAFSALYREGELYRRQYREAIWRSRINLSFLTHSNQDEFAHKSFEIAACGGFLLAERSEGHLDRFREDVEAVFFSDPEECLRKIQRFLPDQSARARIAAAGRQRAVEGGYDNDRQVASVLSRATAIVAQLRAVSES